MRAETFNAMQFPFDVANRVGEIASFDLFYRTGWQLAEFTNFDQSHIFTITSLTSSARCLSENARHALCESVLHSEAPSNRRRRHIALFRGKDLFAL